MTMEIPYQSCTKQTHTERLTPTMTFTERISLLGFGLFTWVTGMVTASTATGAVVVSCAPVMAGVGAGLFVVALLPGRTARFS